MLQRRTSALSPESIAEDPVMSADAGSNAPIWEGERERKQAPARLPPRPGSRKVRGACGAARPEGSQTPRGISVGVREVWSARGPPSPQPEQPRRPRFTSPQPRFWRSAVHPHLPSKASAPGSNDHHSSLIICSLVTGLRESVICKGNGGNGSRNLAADIWF